MTDYNPGGIIPRGCPPSHAGVRDVAFRIRTMVEYDPVYMQDSVRADLFMNDTPTGIYAVTRYGFWQGNPADALGMFGPELERMVIGEFMGLDYRRRVGALEDQVETLQSQAREATSLVSELTAHINRPRWWQIRRLWAARKQAT